MDNVTTKPAQLIEGTLQCPRCKGNNLHHGSVELHIRLGEDQEGILCRIGSKQPYAPNVPGAYLSGSSIDAADDRFRGRRDDLVIVFICENCNARPLLVIRQHKGSTEIYWECG